MYWLTSPEESSVVMNRASFERCKGRAIRPFYAFLSGILFAMSSLGVKMLFPMLRDRPSVSSNGFIVRDSC